MSTLFEGTPRVLQRVIILFKNLLINFFDTILTAWQLLSYLLSDIIFRRLIRSNKLRNVILTCTEWTFYWFLDFLTNLAFAFFAVWRIPELFPYGLLDDFWAWWCTELFSNRFLDAALWWVMFESLFAVLIYWLVNLFVYLRWDSDLFLLWFFLL